LVTGSNEDKANLKLFKSLDDTDTMQEFMQKLEIKAAQLAVGKRGQIKFFRAYTWAGWLSADASNPPIHV